MKRGSTTTLIWILLLGLAFYALINREAELPVNVATIQEASEMIDSGDVRGYRPDGPGVILLMHEGSPVSVPRATDDIWKKLVEAHIPYERQFESTGTSQLLIPLLILAALIVGFLYFLRKMRGTSVANALELRKTKARPVEDSNKAKFADIGGNIQAIELLADVVDFLRSPERWTSAGLRIPRGILVVGPPGTGKTLLARAVAGETKSAFLYTSATEFVEMFVGIGAARVRDTFEKALAQQPAVVFIDELDAIGRRRGSGSGTIHEEREQTLNQLLVLLDGMEQHKRLVVMAATNRPDVLDAALLRPGRFDRMLRLTLPSQSERLEILKIHTRNKPLDTTVSLERIAEQTEGFSGADLEALANAAGLLAVRRARTGTNGDASLIFISSDDFNRAREDMIKSNRQFDRLDSVLVESVSQFAEPVGRAAARVVLNTGTVFEGEVQWMNATHMKLRLNDGSEVIIVKENAAQIESLDSSGGASQADFRPDRWAGRELDAR